MYWPYHVIGSMGSLLPHIHEFVRCRILLAVQQEMDYITKGLLKEFNQDIIYIVM